MFEVRRVWPALTAVVLVLGGACSRSESEKLDRSESEPANAAPAPIRAEEQKQGPGAPLSAPPTDNDSRKRKAPSKAGRKGAAATPLTTPDKKDSIDCSRISEPGYRAKLAGDGIDPDSIDCEEKELTP